jgi:hypothetical protein
MELPARNVTRWIVFAIVVFLFTPNHPSYSKQESQSADIDQLIREKIRRLDYKEITRLGNDYFSVVIRIEISESGLVKVEFSENTPKELVAANTPKLVAEIAALFEKKKFTKEIHRYLLFPLIFKTTSKEPLTKNHENTIDGLISCIAEWYDPRSTKLCKPLHFSVLIKH